MPQEPKTMRCVEVSSLCFDENHAENVSRVPCELWSSHEQCGSKFRATSFLATVPTIPTWSAKELVHPG
jgi:hypothetical protein